MAASLADGAGGPVHRVITAVQSVSRRLDRLADQQLADVDVSPGEWTVLSALARSEHEAPLTPSQLAVAAGIPPSSMTHRLDRMVERGLVTRSPDPTNRTRILVGLTDAGRRLVAGVIRESNVVQAELLAGLTDRQAGDLATLLKKMLAGLGSAAL